MKAYEIVVASELSRSELIDRFEGCDYDEEEINGLCKKVFETLGVHTMTTLEEYFKLLADVSDLTDNEYHIYNDGTYICMYED